MKFFVHTHTHTHTTHIFSNIKIVAVKLH